MAKDDGTEYGGSAGIIQPKIRPDGGSGHTQLTAREQRMVGAIYRKRMAGVDVTIPEDDLHRPAVDAVLADLDGTGTSDYVSRDGSVPGRTAGRGPDEVNGESVS